MGLSRSDDCLEKETILGFNKRLCVLCFDPEGSRIGKKGGGGFYVKRET